MTAQTTEELLKVYEAHRAAMKARDLEAALAPLTEMARERAREELTDPAECAMFFEFFAPLSYEAAGITRSQTGQKATLYFIGTFPVPEEAQKENNVPPTARLEYFVEFEREAGAWKMGLPTITGDPDQIVRPADLNMGVPGDYEGTSFATVGGRIVKVEPAAQGAVYLIRVTDEEVAVWVPPDVEYQASEFTPGQLVEFEGGFHQADSRKMLAQTANVYPY